MAMPQRGRGSGVTGVIDLAGYSAKFVCKVYRYSVRTEGATRPRRGRGGGRYAGIRWLLSAGSVAVTGKIEYGEGWPAPDAFKGQTGTLTIQVAAGKTIAYPIIVTGHDLTHDEFNVDKQYLALTCQFTGEPTYAGWTGSQPAATDATRSDQQQWEGSSLTYDPKNLQDSATITIDWWDNGVADTDAGERTKLIAVMTAATAPTGLKKRPGSISRNATDGGTIILTYGLTDTEDDVEMPGTAYDVDNQVIFGQAQRTVVQDTDTISWPATPTEPADLKRGTTRKQQRHDGKWALTYNFVRNNTKDAIELEGAHTSADPDDLGETARIIVVTNSSTPPSAPNAPTGVLVATDTRPLTVANGSYTGYWVHVFDYGPTTRLQAMEFDGDTIVDPSNIGDAQVMPRVNNTSTPPSTPTPTNTDLKLVRRRIRRIQGTSEKWLHVFEFARNTREDELEHTRRNIDADDFGETEIVPVLHTSATSAPSTPPQAGTTANVVDVEVDRLCVANGSFTGLWLWTYKFGPSTRKQAIEQDNNFTTDESLLAGTDVQTLTGSSITPSAAPSARIASQIHTRTRITRTQHTPQKWRYDYFYAYRSTAAQLEADRTRTTTDVGDLESTAVTGDVWTVASGAPSTPTNSPFTLVDFEDIETDNPAYRLRVYRWAFRTSVSALEAQQARTTTDTAALENTAITADVWTVASGAPSTPTLSGYVLIEHEDVETKNPAYRLRIYRWGLRDRAAALEAARTRTTVDVSLLESSAVTADVWLVSGGAPSTPTLSGYVLIDHEDMETGSPLYRLRVYRWGYRTRGDALEAARTRTTVDVSAIDSSAVTADIWLVSGGAPSTPTLSGYVLVEYTDVETGNPLYRLRVYEWGLVTRQQRIEYGGTILSTDPEQDRDASTSVVSIASYTPATLDGVRDQFVTDNIGLATFDRVDVKRLTPDLAEVRLLSIVQGKILRENIDTRYEVRASRGSSVMVSKVYQATASQWIGRVIPQRILVTVGTIRLRRRVVGSTRQAIFNALDTTHYSNRVGLTNNAAFLGYPVKGLMYLGWDAVQDWGRNGTNHLVDIDFKFALDSIGHYNDEQVDIRSDEIEALPGQSLTIGYNAASKFGWTITEPFTADFSVFLT